MIEIRVPQLAETITEGTISKWFVQIGDKVSEGELLLELETDKVNVEISAEQSGEIKKILKGDGEVVSIEEVIALMEVGGVDEEPVVVDVPQEAVTPIHSEIDRPSYGGSPSQRKSSRGQASESRTETSPPHPVDQGRQVSKEASKKTPPSQVDEGLKPTYREKMSRRRQTIARHLLHSKQNTAMLTTFNEVDMSAVMSLRTRRKEAFKAQHDVSLGFMSFFTKAVVAALKLFPNINAEIDGDEIVYKRYYDVGIAVATEDGLVVPVVRDADRLSFADIERTIVSLAGKARSNKLALEDLRGGTFTITNGGVFGSLLSTPLLNSPQVGILGMHTIQKRPVTVTTAEGDQLEHRPMMYLALSYDHRIVDGKEAVSFLIEVKKRLEDPELLLFG